MDSCRRLAIAVVLGVTALSAILNAQASEGTVAAAARQLVEWHAAKDFTSIVGRFDGKLRQALTVDMLGPGWNATISQFGAFKRIVWIRTEVAQGTDFAHVKCEFERVVAFFHFSFTPTQRVTMLYLTPMTSGAGRLAAVTQIANQLAATQFESVAATFNDDLRSKLSVAMMQQAWSQVTVGRGKLRQITDPMQLPSQAGETLEVTCEFEHGGVVVDANFDAQGRVAGLWVRPAQ